MSSAPALELARSTAGGPRLALLGTGVVGSAFVARHQRLQLHGVTLPAIAWLANSRALERCGAGADIALQSARSAGRRSADATPAWARADALDRGDIVVDATASDCVAGCHARWLARGVHVVTANKLGSGADPFRAEAIARAQGGSGASYGDSATVGAGLPLLRSLRALVRGGDRIHRIEGVLSGSLACLFERFENAAGFSDLVREARAAGYTEPDPRIDLSGEDVRRKLLILSRAAGFAVANDAVHVRSLVPASLERLAPTELDARLGELDRPLAEQRAAARRSGSALRFVARVDARSGSAGLVALPPGHPLNSGTGTDNCVAIYSDRYPRQPLLIQGPGAGADVTAAALMDDVLEALR